MRRPPLPRNLRVSLSTFILWIAASSSAVAGQEVLVGKNVPKAQRIALKDLSHDGWDILLKKFVDKQGMVNYRRWSQDQRSQSELDQYLTLLSSVEFRKSDAKANRLAYWINAYNAVTVKGILREYPTTSIRNHTARLWGYNIWKDLKLQVSGSKFSLEAIEHQVLRKMEEPRIHFAIVCASMSCPKLLNEAYVPSRLDEQLNRNATDFFADPNKFTYDTENESIQLSQIMSWFAADFGESKKQQLAYYAKFAPDAAKPLLQTGQASVSYLKYDWGLNEQH